MVSVNCVLRVDFFWFFYFVFFCQRRPLFLLLLLVFFTDLLASPRTHIKSKDAIELEWCDTHTHTQNARCMCACMASSTPAWPPCHRNNAWLCMIGRDVCAEHSMNVRHCSHLLSSDCAAELTNCINQRCVKLTPTCIWSVAHVWLHSFVDDFPLNSNKLLENYSRIGTNIALLEFYRIDSMIY